MRGENSHFPCARPEYSGTSPRARGKLRSEKVAKTAVRNIPACAGKTGKPAPSSKLVQEHPRVRGENSTITSFTCLITGTSPRARGKQPKSVSMENLIRNIPACAGKTLRYCFRGRICQEHPRVRGENVLNMITHTFKDGTSPRARGKPAAQDHFFGFLRNIPACAGKTCEGWPAIFRGSEHPRVRGENATRFTTSGSAPGTSPRARGKRP